MSNLSLEQLEQQKWKVLDDFDFYKVQDYMKEVDWTWGFDDKIPSILDLQSTALRLLDNVIQSKEPASNSSTGGFTAYKMPWGLSLHFSVESSSSY